ncbi:MAG TPA: triose-phosphate isomerase [Bacteroidia bacterium]|jgi:triosephosphate isomerase|nr:triose-phosphate isomerase [Bacteroidia bacterium]
MRKKIVAGNWKMNKSLSEGLQLIDEILKEEAKESDVMKIIAPPFIHLTEAARRLSNRSDFKVAAQDCHQKISGAYTGEISADMISSTGATHVIIGHSERRMYFQESDELLSEKTQAALKAQLTPIFCIGEKLEERNAGKHKETVQQQLASAVFQLPATDFAKIILAYEPVWAIGTGVTATTEQAQEMHQFIRGEINKKYGHEISDSIIILYGGSCNPQNAKELFACKDVDGGLIGGASLKAADFNAIIRSFS